MNFRFSRALPPGGARSRRDERHSAAGPDHLICPGRAGPLIWLGRAGDACVVGAFERVGDTLYGARVYRRGKRDHGGDLKLKWMPRARHQ